MNIGEFISKSLTQKAVYWGNPVPSGYGNRSTFDSAIEVDCRWKLKQILFHNEQGEQKISHAIVTVNSDLDVGGFLYLGELTDLSSDPNPMDVEGAYEIMGFTKIPSLDGSQFLRKATLGKA